MHLNSTLRKILELVPFGPSTFVRYADWHQNNHMPYVYPLKNYLSQQLLPLYSNSKQPFCGCGLKFVGVVHANRGPTEPKFISPLQFSIPRIIFFPFQKQTLPIIILHTTTAEN